MQEVVGRRYRRLRDEGRAFPDLVVIDGGKGQVAAALKSFIALDLEPPPIIGLAKREETIVFPDARPPLDIPLDHPGLRLLQRLRDEAHRFANTYNADLRSKKIRESLLDDFPGLGPVRRSALLGRFASIERLRNASVDEISEVEGFGPKLAAGLHAFLDGKNAAPAATP
jgi:excinuclease ABC subunit C